MSILNFIKNIFKNESAQHSEIEFKSDPSIYYFHEDYYCQIEYLPKENFSSSCNVATEIRDHSKETFDGYGWTGCYIRNEANVPTKSKSFKVTEITDLLTKEGFSEYPSVTTGYGSAEFPCKNTRAFKKQSIVICLDFNGDIVENIWHNNSPHNNDNELYKTFLLTMGHKYDLLLADWWKSIVVDISSPVEIEKYVSYDS